MTELKPCPFCGYKGVEILADDNEYLFYRFFAQCQKCGAGAKRGHTEEDAIKEWNRRTTMAEYIKREALRGRSGDVCP